MKKLAIGTGLILLFLFLDLFIKPKEHEHDFAPGLTILSLHDTGQNRKFYVEMQSASQYDTSESAWGDMVSSNEKRDITAEKLNYDFYCQDQVSGKIYSYDNKGQGYQTLSSKKIVNAEIDLSDKKPVPPRTSYTGIGDVVPERLTLRMKSGTLKEKAILLRQYGLDPQLLCGNYLAVNIPAGVDRTKIKEIIEKNDDFKAVEEDKVVKVCAAQDLRPTQWNLRKLGDVKWLGNISTTKEVVVAVLDTGIDRNHEDLDQNNILPGYDFLNMDDDPSDDNGHGTEMAGIMAASWNDFGIDGVFPRMKILPVKVLDNQGYGCYALLVQGIYYAIEHGANIINISAAGHGYSEMLKLAIGAALRSGCTVVAAAGNEGNSEPLFPASYNYVISVGASGPDGLAWSGSTMNSAVDFLAPGVDIPALLPGNKYGTTTGTSAAAAHVSGLSAAISLIQGSADYDQVLAGLRVLSDEHKNLYLSGLPVPVIMGTEEVDDTTESTLGFTFEEDAMLKFCLHMDSDKYGEWRCVHQYISGKAKELIISYSQKMNEEFTKYIGDEFPYKYIIDKPYQEIDEANHEVSEVMKPTQCILKTFTGGTHPKNTEDTTTTDPVRPLDNSPTPFSKINYDKFKSNDHDAQIEAISGNDDIIEGSMEEDMFYWSKDLTQGPFLNAPKSDHLDNLELNALRVVGHHFWRDKEREAGNFDAGLKKGIPNSHAECNYSGPPVVALSMWTEAVACYDKNPAKAYYLLGRVAHLLQDMTTPAHVHNDAHNSAFWGGLDSYEEWAGKVNNENKVYNYVAYCNSDCQKANDCVANFKVYKTAKDLSHCGFTITESDWGDSKKIPDLWKLFYVVAEFTDDYSSDGGTKAGPEGSDKIPGDLSDSELRARGNNLIPLAVAATAELYKMFWKATHPELSAYISPKSPNSFWDAHANDPDLWRFRSFDIWQGKYGEWSSWMPQNEKVNVAKGDYEIEAKDCSSALESYYWMNEKNNKKIVNVKMGTPVELNYQRIFKVTVNYSPKEAFRESYPCQISAYSHYSKNSPSSEQYSGFLSGTVLDIPESAPELIVSFGETTQDFISPRGKGILNSFNRESVVPIVITKSQILPTFSCTDRPRAFVTYFPMSVYYSGGWVLSPIKPDDTSGYWQRAGTYAPLGEYINKDFKIWFRDVGGYIAPEPITFNISTVNADGSPSNVKEQKFMNNVYTKRSRYQPKDLQNDTENSGEYQILYVSIEPAIAVCDGAHWRFVGEQNWRIRQGSELIPRGQDFTVEFQKIPGYSLPDPVSGTIENDDIKITATYNDIRYPLIVNITPPLAKQDYAEWSLAGTADWYSSGKSVLIESGATYDIEFKHLTGWTAPVNVSGTMGSTTEVISVTYSPVYHHLTVTALNDNMPSSAKWQLNGTGESYDLGHSVTYQDGHEFLIHFSFVPGFYQQPDYQGVMSDTNETVEVLYTIQGNTIEVTLGPEKIANLAYWRLIGDTFWKANGDNFVKRPGETYEIEFSLVSGYTKPANCIGTMNETTILPFTYEVLSATWTLETSEATFSPRYGYSLAGITDSVYLIGGTDGTTELKDVWKTKNGTNWTSVTAAAPFSARHNQETVFFSSKMWVIGGVIGNTPEANIWSSTDGKSWTSTAITSQPNPLANKQDFQAVVFGKYCYIIGGQTSDGYTNEVWQSANMTGWTKVTSTKLFTPRAMHKCIVQEDKLFLFGGVGANGYCQDIWYTTDGINWNAWIVPEMGLKHGFSLCSYLNKIRLAGGFGVDTEGNFLWNDAWSSFNGFDWKTDSTNTGLGIRTGHQAFIMADKMWVVGGMTWDGTKYVPQNDVWSCSLDHSNLTVAIDPPAAVTAGAKWRFEYGKWRTNEVFTMEVGTAYTMECNTVPYYWPTQEITTGEITGINKTATHGYSKGNLTVNITPEAAIVDKARWKLTSETEWRESGDSVYIAIGKKYQVMFRPIDGWTTPIPQPTTLVAMGTAVVPAKTGTYAKINHNVTVKLAPPAVATAGKWMINSDNVWRASGTLVACQDYHTYEIRFKDVAEFNTPADFIGKLGTSAVTITSTYEVSNPGKHALTVTLTPSAVVADGGWKLTGEVEWRSSGSSVLVSENTGYIVVFKEVPGYTAPAPAGGTMLKVPLTLPASSSTYQPRHYILTVNTLPSTGQWKRSIDTTWKASGATAEIIQGTGYKVNFNVLTGFYKPADVSVEVDCQSQTLSAEYIPKTQVSKYAYVVNYGPDNLSVINLATNKVVSTIAVGKAPLSAAATPAGDQVYVANAGGSSLSVIATATNTVAATINITYPRFARSNPNGKTIYVTYASGSIEAIDIATKTVKAAVLYSGKCRYLAFSPAGDKLYAAGNMSPVIHVVNTATNIETDSMEVPGYPAQIEIAESGEKAYVNLPWEHKILVINLSDKSSSEIQLAGVSSDMALSPDSQFLYVPYQDLGVIEVIETAGNSLVKTIYDSGRGTYAIAFSYDGTKAYATNCQNDQVLVINSLTHTIASTISLPAGSSPVAIAISGTYATTLQLSSLSLSDSRKNLYVNQALDLSGITVTAKYDDLSEKAVTGTWEIRSGSGTIANKKYTASATPSTVTLVCRYGESGVTKEAECTVTVGTVNHYLTVNLSPAEAITGGAMWKLLSDGVWRTSGSSVSLPEGQAYTIGYKWVTGFSSPANLTGTMGTVETTANGDYQPAAAGSQYAYVAVSNSNEVSVIDVAAGSVIKNIPVGSGPTKTLATQDGKFVYAYVIG
ncbi:MAG: S8 family serine peptidase [Candidatus Wallbacteria bacterium]|nr:S8 family serine peptidase [Candidatus Wallbacteria bacterium]